ncbi:GNAT family N-acetyltransferase [Candidatus Nanosalina sp. VS9-1]|uniref:GNAT family N-acetyltransferase n=1 Tax=Candidatus Nanosalina sp. VS9-1 TaxID=3388566 RepID=UPI0039E07F34
MQLNLHENPELLDDDSLDRLVEVAQSAFNKEGQPEREDVVEHIVPSSTFITAEADGDIIGFSSTDRVADTAYAVGLAVHSDYQNQGIGKLARTYGVLQEMGDEDIVSTRTQNPAVLGYMQELFNAYPRQDEKAPENVGEALEKVARALDPDADFEDGVMKEAYPEAMYDEIPDHRLKEFTDELLEYENGDAVIAAGEVSRQDVEEAYESMVDDRSYDVEVVR